MARHSLRRRRISHLTLSMAIVWALLLAGILIGFSAGSGHECLLRQLSQGGGTTCDR